MAIRRPLVNIAGSLQELPAIDEPYFPSKTANTFFAAPNGSAGVPSFRALVAADVPALSYAPPTGSASITTLGTISSGTWQASVLSGTYGGTGVNNGARTLSYAGSIDFTGAFTFTAALTANTSVTFPTSGTLLSTGAAVTVQQGGTGVATITGILKGNGTSAISSAVAGTDYQMPIGTISGLAKGNGANALTAAVVRTDYAEPTTALATGLLKNTTTTGAHSIAVAGTDYIAPGGAIQISTAAISGGVMTGSGVQINSSGTFAMGSPYNSSTAPNAGSVVYDGTSLNLTGLVKAGSSSGAIFSSGANATVTLCHPDRAISVSRTGTTTLPAMLIQDSSGASNATISLTSNTTTPSVNISASAAAALQAQTSTSAAPAAIIKNTGTAREVSIAGSHSIYISPKAGGHGGTYSIWAPAGSGYAKFEDNVGTFTGYHEGIIPPSEEYLQGDIMVDIGMVYKNGISDTLGLVTVSTTPADKKAIGVVVEVIVPDESHLKYGDLDGNYIAIINSLGEGLINVCGESGSIEIGDYICTSSMRGKGMKQASDVMHNYTVARSRESVVFTSVDEVKQIACIYTAG
jgi:hypothetical protein